MGIVTNPPTRAAGLFALSSALTTLPLKLAQRPYSSVWTMKSSESTEREMEGALARQRVTRHETTGESRCLLVPDKPPERSVAALSGRRQPRFLLVPAVAEEPPVSLGRGGGTGLQPGRS